nr:helix-turn-helix domain-containing protein [Streptomyces polyasparticus]
MSPMTDGGAGYGDLDVLGVLNDPVRRQLYRHVAAAPGDVGRDAAAEAVGVSRSLAAHHLDKLVEAGLLAVDYRRLSGKSGPGAGRPAKVYRRAAGEYAVSVPPRSYDEVSRVLADVVERAGLDRELQTAARGAGEAAQGDPEAALAARGYQPFWDGAVLRLRNCPFRALSEEFPALICGMNLALVEGLAAGAEWSVEVDPCGGGCCVALQRTGEAGDGDKV